MNAPKVFEKMFDTKQTSQIYGLSTGAWMIDCPTRVQFLRLWNIGYYWVFLQSIKKGLVLGINQISWWIWIAISRNDNWIYLSLSLAIQIELGFLQICVLLYRVNFNFVNLYCRLIFSPMPLTLVSQKKCQVSSYLVS